MAEILYNGASVGAPEEIRSATRRGANRLWHFLLTNATAFDFAEYSRFSVHQAISEADINAVVDLRSRKYGSTLRDLEPEDLAPNTELFLVRAPDGRPLASIRFSFDLFGDGLLKADKLTDIPNTWRLRLDGKPARLSEGIRFCNAGRSKKEQLYAKLQLWVKVFWRSQDLGVDWLLALAREPLNGDYRRMYYQSPGSGPHWVVPADYPTPHELLALKVQDPTIPWIQPEHWLHRVSTERPNVQILCDAT